VNASKVGNRVVQADEEAAEEEEKFEDEEEDMYDGGEIKVSDIKLDLTEPKDEIDGDYTELIPNGLVIMS
jgi:hypothetical protein